MLNWRFMMHCHESCEFCVRMKGTWLPLHYQLPVLKLIRYSIVWSPSWYELGTCFFLLLLDSSVPVWNKWLVKVLYEISAFIHVLCKCQAWIIKTTFCFFLLITWKRKNITELSYYDFIFLNHYYLIGM